MTKTTVPTAPAAFHVEQTAADVRPIARQLLTLQEGQFATFGATTVVTRRADHWYIATEGVTVGYVSTAAAAALCALGWAAFPEAQAANAETTPAPRGWEAV